MRSETFAMIAKTGMHAVRAMVARARLPAGTYAWVAQEIGAPQNYLGKLLQTLAHEGLVQSQKGLGGGFCLARGPNALPRSTWPSPSRT
jgi:DNA-binding IscR family transcriptional regulator